MGALLGQMELLQIGPTASVFAISTEAYRAKLQPNPNISGANYYRIMSDSETGFYIRQGDSTVTATSSDLLIKAATPLFAVTSDNSNNYLSILAEGSAGNINITRFEVDPRKHDRSVLFNPTNDGVAIIQGVLSRGSVAASLRTLINGAFTILMSARFAVVPGATDHMLLRITSGAGGGTISIYYDVSESEMRGSLTDDEDPTLITGASYTPVAGQWFDIALTFDGDETATIYITDGDETGQMVQLDSTTLPGYDNVAGAVGSIVLGDTNSIVPANPYQGNIKNLRILAGSALSLADLNAVRRTIAPADGVTPVATWTHQWLFDYDYSDSVGGQDLTNNVAANIRFEAPADLKAL